MMDTWPDDLNIESWRQAYRDLQSRGSPSCPPDNHLIALVLHEHPGTEQEQLADHIVSCRRCTDLYQILLRVHRDLTGVPPAPTPLESATTSGEREDHMVLPSKTGAPGTEYTVADSQGGQPRNAGNGMRK